MISYKYAAPQALDRTSFSIYAVDGNCV